MGKKKPPGVPPMGGNGGAQPQGMNLPVVPLFGCQLQVQEHPAPDGTKQKVLLMGPLMLAFPLSDEGSRMLVQNLTGVTIAGPDDLPRPAQFPFREPPKDAA